jgi:hypothetical protein
MAPIGATKRKALASRRDGFSNCNSLLTMSYSPAKTKRFNNELKERQQNRKAKIVFIFLFAKA